MAGTNRAVFLDRDGTVIREVGYLRRLEQIEILPRVPEAIRKLKENGFKVVLVTNQSAVARGILTESALTVIHATLARELLRRGAVLDGIYYCPHHPSEGFPPYLTRCDCRKPNPGLLQHAARDLGLNLWNSYVVGDQCTDMQLAKRVGAKGVWIREKSAEPDAMTHRPDAPSCDFVARDLWNAVAWILEA
jgi:D-glycero-D-manno-heptose 1,7-bisphosphate phosphatase